MKLTLLIGTLLIATHLMADPVIHKFAIWGKLAKVQKIAVYWGWTNGVLHVGGSEESAEALRACLSELAYEQAVAMIDKHYGAVPEKWGNPLSIEILAELTTDGGPCASQKSFPGQPTRK